MQHTPVTSSFIESIAHDGGDHLEVKLKTGKILRIRTGPEEGAEHHAAMQEAESVGSYFAKKIRGKYQVESVEPEEPVF